jgi:hypothetical protein
MRWHWEQLEGGIGTATVMGMLYKTDGTPATGGNQVQFKNRTTGVVIAAPVGTDGKYGGVDVSPPGTYDIGVNGYYTGNNPSSVAVSTLPKVLPITSTHAV